MKNKWALITGASRGIGRATALKLAASGCNILLHYRSNQKEAEKTAKELSAYGIQTALVKADLSCLDETNALAETILQRRHPVDFIVANAAATAFKPLTEIKEHHLAKTFNITVFSLVLLINQLKSLMPEGSKIITISGIDAHRYCANHGLLGAAKSALETITQYYAVELASQKIYTHGLNPGIVDTESVEFYFGDRYEQVKKEFADWIPGGGLVSPETVAEQIHFLCSPAANSFNGEILNAQGGLALMIPVFSAKPHP